MYRKEEILSLLKDTEHESGDDQDKNEKPSTLKWHKVSKNIIGSNALRKMRCNVFLLFIVDTLGNSRLGQKVAASSKAKKCSAIILQQAI